jgi:hypothetical protein
VAIERRKIIVASDVEEIAEAMQQVREGERWIRCLMYLVLSGRGGRAEGVAVQLPEVP